MVLARQAVFGRVDEHRAHDAAQSILSQNVIPDVIDGHGAIRSLGSRPDSSMVMVARFQAEWKPLGRSESALAKALERALAQKRYAPDQVRAGFLLNALDAPRGERQ